ncbi:unnamed protein product, partial [Phaeothamnion confervicola]
EEYLLSAVGFAEIREGFFSCFARWKNSSRSGGILPAERERKEKEFLWHRRVKTVSRRLATAPAAAAACLEMSFLFQHIDTAFQSPRFKSHAVTQTTRPVSLLVLHILASPSAYLRVSFCVFSLLILHFPCPQTHPPCCLPGRAVLSDSRR